MLVDMDLLDDLDARGLTHDTTDRAALAARLREGAIGLYIGFDPTADSLHVGHLVGQLFLRRFQLAGHRPFPLAGGATGMVGDPGGRSEERNLLDIDTLRHNVDCIKAQLTKLLDFESGPHQAPRPPTRIQATKVRAKPASPSTVVRTVQVLSPSATVSP